MPLPSVKGHARRRCGFPRKSPRSATQQLAHAAVPTSTPPADDTNVTANDGHADAYADADAGHTTATATAATTATAPVRAGARPARLRAAPKKFNNSYCDLASESDQDDDFLDGTRSALGQQDSKTRKRPRKASPSPPSEPRKASPSPPSEEEEEEEDDDDDDADADELGEGTDEDEFLAGMLNPVQEKKLREQLKRHLKDLDRCNAQSKGMSPIEKKKLRNRKASRVSRLRKKLSVFDLQRKYQEVLKENEERKAAMKSMEARLAVSEGKHKSPSPSASGKPASKRARATGA